MICVVYIVVIAVILVIAFVAVKCTVVVPKAHKFIVERMGKFRCEWDEGLHILIPFIDKIAERVSMEEKTADFSRQLFVTQDEIPVEIDTVIFYKVTDAKKYTYNIKRPLAALESLSSVALHDIIADMNCNYVFVAHDDINRKLTSALNKSVEQWGMQVNLVELKDIVQVS